MAFNLSNLDKLSAEGNTSVPKLFSYVSSTDSIATIETANYFDSASYFFAIGDNMLVKGSDGSDHIRITAVSPHVTVASEPAVAPGAITNTEINATAAIAFSKLANLTSAHILVGSAGNVATDVAMSGDISLTNAGATAIGAGKVLLAMLGSGIAPSHVVKFAGKQSNGGGSATVAITATGTLTTDLVFAQVEASTNAVNVQKVTPTADTVTVILSGDPGAGTKINWQVLRAAS